MSINTKTKYFYGLGFISVGIKDILYTLFVFFYFNQILGLDPVYTGKAFHGMIAEIAKGTFSETNDIIFVHTGGIFGLFASNEGICA